MTEPEWIECVEAQEMLDGISVLADNPATLDEQEATRRYLRSNLARKLRLFSCACCRQIWSVLVDKRCTDAIEVYEQFIDGLANDEQLGSALMASQEARNSIGSNQCNRSAIHVQRVASNAVIAACSFEEEVAARESADVASWMELSNGLGAARAYQAALLRDIFGNPFRPVTLDPRWLSSTVLDLARTIYDERTFERLPILADALMDAGCDSDEIINHCRGPGPHTRGCFVVDLILEKR